MSLKLASISMTDRGYRGATPENTTYCGYWRERHIPLLSTGTAAEDRSVDLLQSRDACDSRRMESVRTSISLIGIPLDSRPSWSRWGVHCHLGRYTVSTAIWAATLEFPPISDDLKTAGGGLYYPNRV